MDAQALINQSLRVLGVLASGESPSSAESADALVVLNQLLANWSAGGNPVPHHIVETFNLTGAASYTIGSGATFNTTRPLMIKAASVIAANSASRGVDIITADEWTRLPDRTLAGLFAEKLYYNPGYPNGTIYLLPKPSGGTIEVHSLKALSSVASLATTIDFPPGYERALKNALAVELAPEYGRPVDATLAALAEEAKSAVFGLNAALLGHAGSSAPAPEAAA